MADGASHSRFGKLIIAGDAALATYGVYRTDGLITPSFAIGTVVGSVLGWLMPPDLDLPMRTYDEWRVLKRLPHFGKLWVGFWASYGQMFDHRKISHRFILGTISRMLWIVRHVILSIFFVMFYAAMGYISIERLPNVALWFHPRDFWLGIFIGWVIQDGGHLFLDGELRLIPRIRFNNPYRSKKQATLKKFRPLKMEI